MARALVGAGARLIGLTGGIATGKSTAAELFAAAGARVIDADQLARRAVEAGSPALEEIGRAFGPSVIRSDGRLDREALGARIFRDPEARTRLNAMVHPRVEELARREILAIRAADPDALIVYDVPLLFEAGLEDRFDAVVVIYVPREEQVRRLRARDGLTEKDAGDRIGSQMDIETKARKADYVVDNRGSKDELKAQVERLVKRFRDAMRA